jgi:hypothetical protein
MERRQSFYGGASYSREVGLSSVVLFARREVVPAFGLGVSPSRTALASAR